MFLVFGAYSDRMFIKDFEIDANLVSDIIDSRKIINITSFDGQFTIISTGSDSEIRTCFYIISDDGKFLMFDSNLGWFHDDAMIDIEMDICTDSIEEIDEIPYMRFYSDLIDIYSIIEIICEGKIDQ
jgi:hypothetical protein